MISIIIPFHNEAENLEQLISEIGSVLLEHDYEIIFVDDGSTDNSKDKVQNAKLDNDKIKLLLQGKRLGKGKALRRGFEQTRGEIIIFMDADLQDDPRDIPLFLKKLDEGNDVVNGWRKNRQDRQSMNLLSKVGNELIWRSLLGSRLHDVNCGFKVMRRDILEQIPLYGDNFRFVPLIAEQYGFKVAEREVHHRPRIHGKSKYSITKAFSGFFDTITTYFIFRFSEKPLHFFGVIGGILLGTGLFVASILVVQRLFFGVLLYRRPALQFALLFIIVGIQIVMTGIVAELIVYLDRKKK